MLFICFPSCFPASGAAVQIVEQSVVALSMVAAELLCDGLQLRIAEVGRIKFGFFTGDVFVLHLVAQNGKSFCLNRLVLHDFFHSLSVDRVYLARIRRFSFKEGFSMMQKMMQWIENDL